MMRKLMIRAMVLAFLGLVGSAPASLFAFDCYTCETIFNSHFCFPGYPGRTNCTDTITDCAMSGAFCEEIIVIG